MVSATIDLELRSSDPLDACHLAREHLQNGDVRGALRKLVSATRRFPEFGLAWSDLARLLNKAKRPSKAAKAAKRAIKLMPDSSVPWAHLGDACTALGRHGRALKCWELALDRGNHPDKTKIQSRIDGLLQHLRGKDGKWTWFRRKDTDGEELWAISVRGKETIVRQGTSGEKSRKQRKEFSSKRAARGKAQELIAEKLRAGFGLVKRKQRSRGKAPRAAAAQTKIAKQNSPVARKKKTSKKVPVARKKKTSRKVPVARKKKTSKQVPAAQKKPIAPQRRSSRLGAKSDRGKADSGKSDRGKATSARLKTKGKKGPLKKGTAGRIGPARSVRRRLLGLS